MATVKNEENQSEQPRVNVREFRRSVAKLRQRVAREQKRAKAIVELEKERILLGRQLQELTNPRKDSDAYYQAQEELRNEGKIPY